MRQTDKKAHDLVALDISAIASFADFFLLCTGDSARQMQAIADEVEKRLKANGIRPSHVEGYQNSEWILMDYIDLVVHIFPRPPAPITILRDCGEMEKAGCKQASSAKGEGDEVSCEKNEKNSVM